jgi:c-di-GMP-binding flagellar brake protein YcgR
VERIMSIGDKIDVRILNPNAPENMRILYSQVVNMDTEYYYMTVPVSRGIEYPLTAGQQIEIIVYKEDGLFSFKAAFVKKLKTDGINICQISRMSELERNQEENISD